MKKFILPLLGIIAIVVISGCTSSTTGNVISSNSDNQESAYSVPDPSNIDLFSGVKEGDMIRFFFGLNDRIAHNGNVNFRIVDSLNNTVYTSQFSVILHQFVDYQFQLTGNPIGKVYEWKVPYSSLQKGMSSYGYAYLTFTTSQGKTMTSDTSLFGLPQYTEEEINQLYENQYFQSAINVGQTKSLGNFKVTLQRVGFFKYSMHSSNKEYFRADVVVENTGQTADSLSTHDAAVISGKNQYDMTYGGTLDASNIRPGIVREGYILFEDVPRNISGSVRIDVGSHYWRSVDYHQYFTYLYSFNVTI